jgi:hypothetical protein
MSLIVPLIVPPMDQHKKRRLRRWAKSVRRDRLLTLVGSLLIFVTFIVKEAIGDYKDLVSQIELAQYVTEIRSEVENYSRPILIDPGKPQDTIALDRREVKWFWHALAKATSPSVRKVRP